MPETVSEFACRDDGGPAGAPCVRKRWHAGDHRAPVDGHLVTWADGVPRDLELALPEAPLLRRLPDLEPLEAELEATGWPEPLVRALTALVWVLVVIMATGWPLAIVAVLRT